MDLYKKSADNLLTGNEARYPCNLHNFLNFSNFFFSAFTFWLAAMVYLLPFYETGLTGVGLFEL